MNYAWFYTQNADDWRLINSLSELRGSDAPVMLEYGNPQFREIDEVTARTLPELLEHYGALTTRILTSPFAVFGLRNVFAPLAYHWVSSKGKPAPAATCDILEHYVLPGAAPTVQDRTSVDRGFAEWFAGRTCAAPVDFLFPLLFPNQTTT